MVQLQGQSGTLCIGNEAWIFAKLSTINYWETLNIAID